MNKLQSEFEEKGKEYQFYQRKLQQLDQKWKRDFFQSKKDMAVFFSTQILPNVFGLSKSICSEIFELEAKRIDNILGSF